MLVGVSCIYAVIRCKNYDYERTKKSTKGNI